MSEKEFLVDAVAQFLQTSAWQDAINEFFAANYAKFPVESPETADEKQSKGVGYSLDQFDVFTQFKELIEKLLEGVMGELGCSGQDLVEILEESVQKGTTGERRFLIKTLLSFEEYEDFHARITEYAALQAASGGDGGGGEMAEWQLQLALAQSLLDANEQGLLDETEQSFLPWAMALVGMSSQSTDQSVGGAEYEAVNADEKEGGEPSGVESTTAGEDGRLKELEYTLIKERLKVDLLVAQRIAEANAAMKKEMLHLTANATANEDTNDETGDAKASENDLDALFAQLETVRDRLKVVKTKCFEFKSVSQEAMDEMYLFLKEKIHFQQDLVSQEQEISDFIFSRIQQSDASLVPLLLEWLLLESEGLRMQYQIQEALGQTAPDTSQSPSESDGFWTQSWDENAQAFFYFHSVSGESVWEPPGVGFYDANQDYQIPEPVVESPSVEATQYEEAKEGNSQEVAEMEAMINSGASQNPADLSEMERVLEKISREHDEERKRLELVFEVEKARQKEELRRRKEKKRRDRLFKKKKKEEREAAAEDANETAEEDAKDEDAKTTPRQTMMELPPIVQSPMKAESKEDGQEDDATLGVRVPGRGRIELAHLLSESHAKRQLEKHGLSLSQLPAPQALLNPTSLRYLAESLAKKNPHGWLDQSPKSSRGLPASELVLEEAEEK